MKILLKLFNNISEQHIGYSVVEDKKLSKLLFVIKGPWILPLPNLAIYKMKKGTVIYYRL